MGFFEKIQDRKGRAARLGGVFQGREHRLGILMAALVLTAAALLHERRIALALL